jgi:hypothetical protein
MSNQAVPAVFAGLRSIAVEFGLADIAVDAVAFRNQNDGGEEFPTDQQRERECFKVARHDTVPLVARTIIADAGDLRPLAGLNRSESHLELPSHPTAGRHRTPVDAGIAPVGGK